MTKTSQVTIWFDGGCPLCRREIAWIRRLDRKGALDIVDLRDPQASCPLDRQAMLARFHALEDGRLLHGAAAFAAMWRAVPALRPIGLLARYRPVLWLLEKAYLGFLPLRPALQRIAARGDRR